MRRTTDGSAGDADYGTIGPGYSGYRRPEPRIAALIEAALAGSRTVLNIGAGAGSYESTLFEMTAVEPSESMRAQRPAHLPAAVDAVAENLPFPDGAFDGAMTTFSEMLLDPAARKACSAWSFVDAEVCEEYTGHLRRDLESGAWDEKHGRLRQQPYFQGSLVLVRAVPGA
ncbi:class I SAM-dependent methyltransferase [Catenulispora subtropica]